MYDIDEALIDEMMLFKMLQLLNKIRARGPRTAGGSPLALRPGTPRSASASPLEQGLALTIRFGSPGDERALRRLAALDSQQPPPPPAGAALLVAEVGGELWAAVSIAGERRVIADPFRHTAALVAMLEQQADRLARAGGRPGAARGALRLAHP